MSGTIRLIAFITMAYFAFFGTAHAEKKSNIPDLTVARITFVRGVFTGECNEVRVDVKNSRKIGVSQPIPVRLTSPTVEGSETINGVLPNGIGPGRTASVTFTGVFYGGSVTATVDPTNVVAESKEGNNERTLADQPIGHCPLLRIEGGVSASEGDPVRFTVSMEGKFPETVTVLYSTSNGTAKGGGSCDKLSESDFLSVEKGTVRFQPGVTKQTISIKTCADSISDDNETFSVRIYNVEPVGKIIKILGKVRDTGIGKITAPVTKK